MAIGGNGHPIIAFRNYDSKLVIAKCNNVACTGVSSTTIKDASYPFVSEVRATAGADGFLLVASTAGPTPSGPRFLVRHCQDLACKSSNRTEIDAYPPNDAYAIGTDANGFGVVAYDRSSAAGSQELVLAHCVDQACTSVTKTVIDTSLSPFVIRGVSVRKMADNRVLVVYSQSGVLKAARCVPIDSNPCATATTSVLDESAGFSVSLALGGDGKGLIGYLDDEFDYRLRVAHCEDAECSAIQKGAAVAERSTPFALGSTAESPSLGLAVFSNAANRLATEHCADVACSAFSPSP